MPSSGPLEEIAVQGASGPFESTPTSAEQSLYTVSTRRCAFRDDWFLFLHGNHTLTWAKLGQEL